MPVAFPDRRSYDRARQATRQTLGNGPGTLGRKRKSSAIGGKIPGVRVGVAAEDIASGLTGSVNVAGEATVLATNPSDFDDVPMGTTVLLLPKADSAGRAVLGENGLKDAPQIIVNAFIACPEEEV